MHIRKTTKPAIQLTSWLLLCVIILGIKSCNSQQQMDDVKDKIRIITLAPHLAELVYSAGAIDNLVGVVSYSDFPESVKNIQQIGDAFKLDYETLITLKPDYILTWKDGTPLAIIEKLKSLNLNIIETKVTTLADIPKTIAQIAQLTNTAEYADKNIKFFNEKLNSFKVTKQQSKTAFIETYHQPIYTVSGKHWMSEAIGICGYSNIFSDLSQLSAPIGLESVISTNPDTIITIANTPDDQWQKWQEITAVKTKSIVTISPDLFSRPSMRLLEGIEQLCKF